MAKPRGATSYRLGKDTQHLLSLMAERLGLSKTAVVEMAIRKLAHNELGATLREGDLLPGDGNRPDAAARSVPGQN